MALKFSEMTALRVDLARNLEAGFDNYQEEIARGYGEFVAPLLEEGETAPDISFQVELMKRSVARSRRRLASFDSPLIEQTHEDARVRAEIELRQLAVNSKLRQLRHVCRGLFGEAGVARVGLKEEPPTSTIRLHEHAKTVKESLELLDSPPSGGTALGLAPLLELDLGESVATPAVQLASQLEPELSRLGELVGDRHQENRKSADVRSRRRTAIEEFDRDIRAVVRSAQGMFRIAGRSDLAARFRPLLRRALRRTKKAEVEQGGEPQTDETTEPTAPVAETASEA